jgi:hypothetical protein
VCDLAGTAERLAAALRQTDVLDLALILQLLQLLNSLLNGSDTIEAWTQSVYDFHAANNGFVILTVSVVEVDLLDLQSAEGLFASSTSVFRRAVNAAVAVLVDLVGELGREEDLLTLPWV